MQIITAPVMTVVRIPNRSAIGPIKNPPAALPNQDSDPASDGMERAPPISAAIDFSPTTAIHGAPSDMVRQVSETKATTQEYRVSIVCGFKLNPGP
jgi:hypothetical protein